MAQTRESAQLTIRLANIQDVKGIAALVDRAYPNMSTYAVGVLRGQISNFPEGPGPP